MAAHTAGLRSDEARLPIFSMDASEFVEVIVGIGQSHAWLLEQARDAAPGRHGWPMRVGIGAYAAGLCCICL